MTNKKTHVVVTPNEVLDVITTLLVLRNSGRSLAYANLTLDDIRKEAIKAIGGSDTEKPDATGDLPGKIERLKLLKSRLDDLVTRAEKREK